MMSNNRRLAPVINDHLPIEEASEEYSCNRRKFEKMAAIIQQVTLRSISHLGSNILMEESKPTDETDLRLSLITRRVAVKRDTNKACFLN